MADRKLVFVDTETTGLIHGRHHVIELAYQTLEMEKPEVIFPMNYSKQVAARDIQDGYCDPKALEINRFFERYPGGVMFSPRYEQDKFFEIVQDATLVGANPRFDARMIVDTWKFLKFLGEPWHHRLLDMQAYVAGYFGLPGPLSWKECVETVESSGSVGAPPITVPDHSAAADCQSVKDVYVALRGANR